MADIKENEMQIGTPTLLRGLNANGDSINVIPSKVVEAGNGIIPIIRGGNWHRIISVSSGSFQNMLLCCNSYSNVYSVIVVISASAFEDTLLLSKNNLLGSFNSNFEPLLKCKKGNGIISVWINSAINGFLIIPLHSNVGINVIEEEPPEDAVFFQ